MVALLGSDVVPVAFAGKTAANVTYGHRVLFGEAALAVKAPGDYEAVLLGRRLWWRMWRCGGNGFGRLWIMLAGRCRILDGVRTTDWWIS